MSRPIAITDVDKANILYIYIFILYFIRFFFLPACASSSSCSCSSSSSSLPKSYPMPPPNGDGLPCRAEVDAGARGLDFLVGINCFKAPSKVWYVFTAVFDSPSLNPMRTSLDTASATLSAGTCAAWAASLRAAAASIASRRCSRSIFDEPMTINPYNWRILTTATHPIRYTLL